MDTMTCEKPSLPTLAQLIGDGERGEGWDELEKATRHYLTFSKDGEAAELVRFLRLFSLAAVEGARQSEAAGADYADTVIAMCKAAGIAVATAAVSVVEVESRHRLDELRKLLVDEVASGIRFMIDHQVAEAAHEG